MVVITAKPSAEGKQRESGKQSSPENGKVDWGTSHQTSRPRTWLTKQLLFEVADDLAHLGIDLHAFLHQTAGMQHSAVIAPAKGLADRVEGTLRQLAREEHGDLPWERNLLGPAFAFHVGQTDVKMLGDLFLNHLDANGKTAFLVKDLTKEVFDAFESGFLAGQRSVGSDADEGALEPPDVGANAVGQEINDFVRELDSHGLFLLAQNGNAGFHVRGLHICYQTPLETRDEAFL